MEADDEPIKEFSGNISSLDEQMEKMNDKNSDQEDQLLKLRNRIKTLEMILEYNTTKLQEKVSSQENIITNLTRHLESTQDQLVRHAAALENLNSSTTTIIMEFKQVWIAVNTTKQERDNLTKKVDQEFENIRQDVRQTKGSLLNETNSSLNDFENKVNSEIRVVSLKLNEKIAHGDYLSSSLESLRKNVTNRVGKLKLRVKMEQEKSCNTTKITEHQSKLIQHLTNSLNGTREDMKNVSREHFTALEQVKNSTVGELQRVRMLVNSTQTVLLVQLKRVHENMTKKVAKETEKLEARIQIEENKSNNTKQITDEDLKKIRQIESLLNVTRENVREELKNHFTALWLAGNSTKMDLQSVRMVLNVTRDTIVGQLKKVQDNLTEQVKNVSKMPGPIGPPGFNGSQGPVGPQGAVGPAGPKGSGDFSQCQFKTETGTMTPGSNRILVHFDEPANEKIMAVTCSTDYHTEYNLISRVQASGVRRYVCTCDGKSTLFTRGTSCYLNYWICPLTT
ncbi:collectin-12-like isoform X2 [Stylophora pistillata]|uniref:collectin-12-like isoform X2 n=1 Tax=Stylophora pistillata TaxID=50429 RepID=UPI000C045471|nr:collectin-12-like isoform X2 [Stylophora pistillata]